MRRNRSTTLSTVALAAVGLLGLAGCDVDVPDLNNPGLDQLEENPTATGVAAACTGLLIGTRAGTSAANGYVSQLGILGRESYNFDAADPRYVGELLAGELQPGSPFGGNFWTAPYANIRLGEIVLDAVDRVAEFDEAQKAAIRGFVHTIKAMDLLRVIITRDTVGGVIDTDREGVDELGPIASRDEVYTEIARLLDEGAEELAEGGEAFPFPLSGGYSGFDTPATFLTFNRAIRARVAAYMEDYDVVMDALAESFIDDMGSMDLGVYHSYGVGTGDAPNALTNPNIFAHTSIVADAQMNGVTDEVDARLTAKIVQVPEEDAGGAQGLTSDLKFTMYASPTAPVPIIRNEELILLRAEAAWAMGDLDAATADLDIVRTVSGGLQPLPATVDTADEVEDELLYNRRYSLLFEGGHRWIDLRRFDRLDELPLDAEGHVVNVRYPLPSAECDGRPGEAACGLSSLGD